MSICINNNLIWVSIPRTASTSIEAALISHPELNTNHYMTKKPNVIPKLHGHIRVSELYDTFGKLDTVRIKRNWIDYWVSLFGHFWFIIDNANLTPKVKFEDVDNDYIYSKFNHEFHDYQQFTTN